MTIEIKEPELEALIRQRIESGAFQSVEEILWQGLKTLGPKAEQPAPASKAKDLVELFAPLRGLNLDFGRNPSTGRPVDLE